MIHGGHILCIRTYWRFWEHIGVKGHRLKSSKGCCSKCETTAYSQQDLWAFCCLCGNKTGCFRWDVRTSSSCVVATEQGKWKHELFLTLTLSMCLLCLNLIRPLAQGSTHVKFETEPKETRSCNVKSCWGFAEMYIVNIYSGIWVTSFSSVFTLGNIVSVEWMLVVMADSAQEAVTTAAWFMSLSSLGLLIPCNTNPLLICLPAHLFPHPSALLYMYQPVSTCSLSDHLMCSSQLPAWIRLLPFGPISSMLFLFA